MAAALLLHLGDGELRDVKEAGDVAGYRDDFIIFRPFDRARCRNHPVVVVAVSLDEGRADTLRRAGNDGYFLFDDHSKPRFILPSDLGGPRGTAARSRHGA